MKRTCYFISATNHVEDKILSEVVHALREDFPYTEAMGVVGDRLSLAGVGELKRKEDIDFKLFKGIRSQSAANDVVKEIVQAGWAPIILAGINEFHRSLMMKAPESAQIFLVVTTSFGALSPDDLMLIKTRGVKVLGIFPGEEDFYKDYGFSYTYIGFPYLNRLRNVFINKSDFVDGSGRGLTYLTTYIAGEALKSLHPMIKLARKIYEADKNVTVVAPLPRGLNIGDVERELGIQTESVRSGVDSWVNVRFFSGMAWEALFVADLVVSGGGISGLEAALLGKPQIGYMNSWRRQEPLLNLLTSEGNVPQYSKVSFDGFAQHVLATIGSQRSLQDMKEQSREVADSFEGLMYHCLIDVFVEFLGRRSIAKRRSSK